GRYLGGFQPAANAHGRFRLLQYRRSTDNPFSLAVAGRIVTAKLYNQRRVIQRLAANRRASDPSAAPSGVEATLAWLDALFASIGRAGSIDEVRGYEGASTARYFQAWSSFLPPAFPFERRSTRPPLNPVNA